MSRRLIPVLLVLGTAAFSLPRLGDAPMFVAHDEIVYSLQARELASTGRDLSGRFLPMYIEYSAAFGRPTWDQPLLIYAIAATLKILPFSEFAIRLPMALLAILDVLLIYFVAKVVFGGEGYAAAAAVLLALTPSHFMHGRQAIDFQLSLPFILGWLLCLVVYVRTDSLRWLFAAGAVLGTSLFGYVAAYVFVPIFAVSTLATLWRRGDALARYGWFAGGLAAPCVLCLPWMLRFPLPFRDLVAHYAVLDASTSNRRGLIDVVRGFAASSLRGIPSLYADFFDPAFLFINGPRRFRAFQLIGVFTIAVAGALVVGVLRALRRPSTEHVLILVGFLSGPLVASLGGEGQAVWRTLQLAPFGVLLAVVALQFVRTVDTPLSRSAAIALFAVPIALGTWYHDVLPQAQALVRAASVPVAVAGLAACLARFELDRVGVLRIAFVSSCILVGMHLVYFVVDHATSAGVLLMVALAAGVMVPWLPKQFATEPLAAAALLALVTGQFMYLYVDYGQMPRIGPIPPSVILMALRLALSSLALAAVLLAATRTARSRPPLESRAALLWAAVVAIQLAYYWIDAFTDYRLRALHVGTVVIAVVGLALRVGRTGDMHSTLARIAVAGLFGLVSIQFTSFAIDYFTDFQRRGSADVEGNVREAFESVIARAHDESIPAIYLGRIGPYYYGDLFWKFYLTKHRREDLLQRTIADKEFNADRIRSLPAGSIVITSPTRQIDNSIDRLATEGVLTSRELLKAPDGAPIFWILQTSRR